MTFILNSCFFYKLWKLTRLDDEDLFLFYAVLKVGLNLSWESYRFSYWEIICRLVLLLSGKKLIIYLKWVKVLLFRNYICLLIDSFILVLKLRHLFYVVWDLYFFFCLKLTLHHSFPHSLFLIKYYKLL